MSTPRKLGVSLCLLGFVAVCVLALVLNTGGPFAGLRGIQSNLADEASIVVGEEVAAPLDASQATITAEGRDLSVRLPEVVLPGFDKDRLTSRLEGIDGVRSVELLGDPTIAAAPDDGAATDPTPAPTAEPAPEPTAVPTTVPTAAPTAESAPEPTPEPTAVPTTEPTAAPTAEPAPEPTPEPTEAPDPVQVSLDEVVAGLELEELRFEPGTARFTAQDTAVLDGVADQLQGLSGGPVQVQAHTDNVGDPDVNLLLSQDRAEAVVAYLIDRGVDASLLTSRGFGAQAPIADNTTEQGRAANQRVVLVVEGN